MTYDDKVPAEEIEQRTYENTAGIHYEIDTVGSRLMVTK